MNLRSLGTKRMTATAVGAGGVFMAIVTTLEDLSGIPDTLSNLGEAIGLIEKDEPPSAARDLAPSIAQFSRVDSCEKLWLERNAIYNRNGRCFRSALGKAVFDNSDCVGRSNPPTIEQERRTRRIYRWETVMGCYVDTSRETLTASDGGAKFVFGKGGHVFKRTE